MIEDIFMKIDQLRKEEATLKEFSTATGLSVSFLSQVERGTTSLAITSLKKIADALVVPMVYFLKMIAI